MFESIAAFLSGLRQTGPLIFSGIAIGAGVILFVPLDIAKTLGLDAFRNEHRPLLGFGFVGSLSIVLVHTIWNVCRYLAKKHRTRKKVRVREQYLHDLSADEKAYLLAYIDGGENTQYFQMEDGVAAGLRAKGILYQPGNIGNLVTGIAHNIQPWVKDYLTVMPFLLDGYNPEPSGPPNLFKRYQYGPQLQRNGSEQMNYERYEDWVRVSFRWIKDFERDQGLPHHIQILGIEDAELRDIRKHDLFDTH